MCERDYDFIFKIVIIGDAHVGKTSLLSRFTDDKFNENYLNTLGVDFKLKTVKVNDHVVKLNIWDTAGEELYNSLTTAFYRGCHGFVLVFSLTEKKSFTNLSHWLKEIDKNANSTNVRLLVGNKLDLNDERVVSFEQAKIFADSRKLQYIETSAKSSENVEEAFLTLADDVITLFPNSKLQNDVIKLDTHNIKISESPCSYC